jgi:FixJ family two-component response regulator
LNCSCPKIAELIGKIDELLSVRSNDNSGRIFFEALSPRENQICSLIIKGECTKEISVKFGTSTRTVESQRNIIRRKFGIYKKGINLQNYLMKMVALNNKPTKGA